MRDDVIEDEPKEAMCGAEGGGGQMRVHATDEANTGDKQACLADDCDSQQMLEYL